MAKFYGSAVKKGRVGGSVFAIRNGVTIERQYQPSVYNPSTIKQIGSRSKLKLLSQLSEVMAPILGFRRNGLVSPRNLFTKFNYGIATFNSASSTASIAMGNVKLTASVLGFVPLAPERATGNLTLKLQSAPNNIDAVAYGVLRVMPDNSFRLVYSAIIDTAGEDGKFATEKLSFAGNATGYAYAYGIRFNSEAARALYNDIKSQDASAVLDVIRLAVPGDFSLTDTVSAAIAVAP